MAGIRGIQSMFWKRKSHKEPEQPVPAQSEPGAVDQGLMHLSKVQLAVRIQELQWQLSWWEANYGGPLGLRAPTRKDNAAMMAALDEALSHEDDDEWWWKHI